MTTLSTKEPVAHPFELAGMGHGPYRFVGLVEMPNLSENSASNFGGNNPYAEVQSFHMKAGAGTCACCGMAITVICVVQDGLGDNWGVGSDCVEKLGTPALCNAAKVAVAKRRNKMAAARREVKRQATHQKWLAALSTKPGSLPGETNASRMGREDAERCFSRLAAESAVNARRESFKDILSVLEASGNDFYKSLASQLSAGPLSERQAHFVAKAMMGRQNKANSEQWEAVLARCIA